ncbi:MAG: hypothetical protein KKB59_18900 [Spirochaetes bacterium]|nr:hypothetical protein [Spirochaetota bacterium]
MSDITLEQLLKFLKNMNKRMSKFHRGELFGTLVHIEFELTGKTSLLFNSLFEWHKLYHPAASGSDFIEGISLLGLDKMQENEMLNLIKKTSKKK